MILRDSCSFLDIWIRVLQSVVERVHKGRYDDGRRYGRHGTYCQCPDQRIPVITILSPRECRTSGFIHGRYFLYVQIESLVSLEQFRLIWNVHS